MLKIKYKNVKMSLNEIPQPSNLRWKSLYRVNDNEFVDSGPWIKCRDYFNDMVWKYNGGKGFSIYGFNVDKIPLNKGEGFYFALKSCEKDFEKNFEYVNAYLKEKGHPQLDLLTLSKVECDIPEVQYILHLSDYYCQNSFYTSFVTALVRACAYNKKIEVVEDLFKTEQLFLNLTSDTWSSINLMFNPKNKKVMDKLKFFYNSTGKCFTSELIDYPVYIHNNGFRGWASMGSIFKKFL